MLAMFQNVIENSDSQEGSKRNEEWMSQRSLYVYHVLKSFCDEREFLNNLEK